MKSSVTYLLPIEFFKPLAITAEISFETIVELAERFNASLTATGSRFALSVDSPCAFVLTEQGKIRYSSISIPLREASGWIRPRTDLPSGSLSEKVRAGDKSSCPQEIDADLWFDDWAHGGVLLEEARYLKEWDQTLSLLWFEDEEIPMSCEEEKEYLGIDELDGILPWPGKKRRK